MSGCSNGNFPKDSKAKVHSTKPKQASPAPNKQKSQSSGQDLDDVKIKGDGKKIECVKKSGFFQKNLPKYVQWELKSDGIILKGPDKSVLKKAKDSVKKCIQDVKFKDKDITDCMAKVLTKEKAVDYINSTIGLDEKAASWRVDIVADQMKLNVFAFKEKEADSIGKKILQCVMKETVPYHVAESQWFKDFLNNEEAQLSYVIDNEGNAVTVVYMTSDIYKKFTDQSQALLSVHGQKAPVVTDVVASNSGKRAPVNIDSVATNAQGQTAALTSNQSQPNQLSFNGPNSAGKSSKSEVSVSIALNHQQIKYLDVFLSEKLLQICRKKDIDYDILKNSIMIKGKQKYVDPTREEIKKLLDTITVVEDNVYCVKLNLPQEIKMKIKQQEEDKECLCKVERCKIPRIRDAWVVCSEVPKMHIVHMDGPVSLAKADLLICPVTSQLEPIGCAAKSLQAGWATTNTNGKFDLSSMGTKKGKKLQQSLPLFNTGNLNCQCLYLVVQEQLTKGIVKETIITPLAEEILVSLHTNGYQSIGLAIEDEVLCLQTFSFSLITNLWKCSSQLKYPFVVCCYTKNEAVLRKLESHLTAVGIDKNLCKASVDPFWEKSRKTSEVEVKVENGSILDFDKKVDVIVNSVGTSLDLKNGMVSKKLIEKGGLSIEKECASKYPNGIGIGELAVTNAGKMQCQKIFHVALYTHWVPICNLSVEILKSIIKRCLKEADVQGLTSIAFPALGTGTLGYPPCLVAKTMFDAVNEFGATQSQSDIRNVYFVLYGDAYVLEIFRNVELWQKHREESYLDVPPQYCICTESNIETKMIVADKGYYIGLMKKELRIVLSGKTETAWKLEWDTNLGCYCTTVKIGSDEESIENCARAIVEVMDKKKFHIVDIMIPKDVSLTRFLETLWMNVKMHGSVIDEENKKRRGKKVLPEINYVNVIRVFTAKDVYDLFVQRWGQLNGDAVWHVSETTAYPFIVEVVGNKKNVKDVLKDVTTAISSIEATTKCTWKVKRQDISKVKKAVKELCKDAQISLDEALCLVTCEGTSKQISSIGKEFEKFIDTTLSVQISENDYAALIYITNDEAWRSYVTKHEYTAGKAVFELERSAHIDDIKMCIESKLEVIHQLASTEVISQNPFHETFPILQSKVEDLGEGVFCFLSQDKQKILVKSQKYELVEQAKHLIEVDLGMIQLTGRRNRVIAAEEYSRGPATNQGVNPDSSIKQGKHFKTAEGIDVLVYSAGIGNLQVDTLVNAANKDLQHGGGIAYHISNSAGYELDRECDDYIYTHGPLRVGTCVSTAAGKLPYKSIIHAVGPMWHSYPHNKKQQCLDDLKQTVVSAITEAASQGLNSIALPAISSGIFGVPKELCTDQYYRAVIEYSRHNPQTSIREIHFIDKDRAMCTIIQKTFEREFGSSGQKM